MARRTIDPLVQAQVLQAAQVEGANLPAVAKQFGISLPTVYNYLRKAKEVAVETVQA
jgi:transposase